MDFVQIPLGVEISTPGDIQKIHLPTKQTKFTKTDPEKPPPRRLFFVFSFRMFRVFRGEKCFAFGFPIA